MNRNYYYPFLLTLSILFLLPACKKKDRTLEADLTVVNTEDGSAVSGATIIYEYIRDNQEFKEEVGTTDDDGKFHFNRQINKTDAYTKFRIHAEGFENVYTNGFEVDLVAGSDNAITKELTPCYHFLFSIKNMACFNQTDSIWVSDIYQFQPYPIVFTGCTDTILDFMNQYPFTDWSYVNSKTISYTVKRNGVVTTNQVQIPMQFKQVTPIHIAY